MDTNRVWQRIATFFTPSMVSHKLLLAFKAALAVGIAWVVAPFMPGVADEYPYYAPLGALLSMHSTLKGSAKYGLQILGGLAIGILLAAIVLAFGAPNFLTISLVVAAGVLVGGMRWLGAPGQEYLPIAALFVLIVGGQDASQYSIGYLVQMTVGVSVGLLINLLVLPPLTFDSAVQKFSHFRRSLARHLNDVGTALTENWPPEREDWASQNQTLSATAAEVRKTIHLADDSRKGNPRARIHKRNLEGDFYDLAALENVTFHIRDLTEVLAGAVWGKPFPVELPTQLCPPLSEAILAVADVLTTWEDGAEAQESLDRAEAGIETLFTGIDEHRTAGPASMSAAATIAMALQRILSTVRLRIQNTATGQGNASV
ncbi:FUSC family protein [Arthrobacter sp. H14]|uniref:FUSC family protein n=1 Tax=Arthrobacter sp. H14 TaxID=1312959 RepID=UPI0004B7A2EF|nr:FUSC family protein [Arthrobacter sp. H14]